jgi:hypothetical protein
MHLELWVKGKKRKVVYPDLTIKTTIQHEIEKLLTELPINEKDYQIYMLVPSKANDEG